MSGARKKKPNAIPRESDLYRPIHDYLVAQGYTVRGEVKDCDVAATRGDDLVLIELKRSFGLALLEQAAQRQRAGDSIYVAIPRPPEGIHTRRWKSRLHLLRRLEVGLILVSFRGSKSLVEVVFHPLPFERKKRKQAKRAILTEIAGRSVDLNEGGSNRRTLMTAYRENAIQIACCLDHHGPLAPSRLRALGTGAKTLSILSGNFYGWFERVARGVYALTVQGKAALETYPDLVRHYREQVPADPMDQR